MIVSNMRLKNWRNFLKVDTPLRERVFVVGPNASGKSNLLDAFRFLRDVAKPGGGLQKAISDRGGVKKIRCLSARRDTEIELDVELSSDEDSPRLWRYQLCVKQAPRGDRKPYVTAERVWNEEALLLDRPNSDDRTDEARLTQTHLEQISANKQFRDVAEFFKSFLYLHVVPQLIRHAKAFPGPGVPGDPFGKSILERIGKANARTRSARLKRIEAALRSAVPQLKALSYVVDREEGGVPHLEAVYDHWRPQGARHRETEFSDGTLRLLGLLWALQDGEAPLLLEEPELSLNAGIVSRLPAVVHRISRQSKNRRQVIVSTHSADLLSDRGIDADEVLLLNPGTEGTEVTRTSTIEEVRDLLEGGLTAGEAIMPRTVPATVEQLVLFDV